MLLFAQIIFRNFDFGENCENNFAQIAQRCANLLACDAEQCGILRKRCSASYANDAQNFAKTLFWTGKKKQMLKLVQKLLQLELVPNRDLAHRP